MEMVQRTDVGKVRDLNEDSVYLKQLPSGFVIGIIADGMGGHQAGDVASRHAVEAITEELLAHHLDVSTEEKKDILLTALGKANERVYSSAVQNKQLEGMGTTVVAALADDKEVVLAHVGDSRAYMFHQGSLYQLTVDHSYVEFLKKHGEITAEEAETHPQRNMILRAVGTSEEVEVDLINTPWHPQDILLICSDGLTTMVNDTQIGSVLSSPVMTLEEQAEQLIERALYAGGRDNISLILLKHTGSQ